MVLLDSSGPRDSSTTGDYRPRHKPLQLSGSQVQLDRCWLPQHISDAILPLGVLLWLIDFMELLIVFLCWQLSLLLLVQGELFFWEEVSRSDPAWFLKVLCPKCVVSWTVLPSTSGRQPRATSTAYIAWGLEGISWTPLINNWKGFQGLGVLLDNFGIITPSDIVHLNSVSSWNLNILWKEGLETRWT